MCASYGVCVSMCAHYSLGSQDRLFPEQDGVEGGWDITVFHKCACDMPRSCLCLCVCVCLQLLVVVRHQEEEEAAKGGNRNGSNTPTTVPWEENCCV